jgi:hypothetical protein
LRAVALRLLIALLLAASPGCSLALVRPVIHKEAPDHTVKPTCFSNSYLWPALDVAAAAFFLVAPAVVFKRSQYRCAAGDDTACSSTSSLILIYTLVGVPAFGGSAYSGFKSARQCRTAGSSPRWRDL